MVPSPQERNVLRAASANIVTAPMNTTTATTTTATMNNNNHHHHHHTVKQPRTVVMMRTPSQNTDDGDTHYKRTAESTSSLSFQDEDEALAAASARAGENVYDSPNSSPRKRINDRGTHNNNNNIRNNDPPPVPDENNMAALPVGFLASGLAWVQRSRETRRRKYLQLQAEQQLQKIKEAECAQHLQQQQDDEEQQSIPTFLQMRNFDGTTTTNDDENNNSFRVVGPPKLSKSGEGASAQLDLNLDDDDDDCTVPKVRIAEGSGGAESPYILTPEQMHQIAIHVLPKTVAYCRWRRLYGLGRDGDSFDGCLRKIDSVSRTLMVVKTTKGEIFGGYADSAWHSHALSHSKFYGGAGACLFSFQPGTSQVNAFHWTGKNRYIQLCDVSRKMLAFGGGGEIGVFGLAVEEDFQKGSTGPCDTFDNDQLCSEEVFEILDVEFWEFLTGMF